MSLVVVNCSVRKSPYTGMYMYLLTGLLVFSGCGCTLKIGFLGAQAVNQAISSIFLGLLALGLCLGRYRYRHQHARATASATEDFWVLLTWVIFYNLDPSIASEIRANIHAAKHRKPSSSWCHQHSKLSPPLLHFAFLLCMVLCSLISSRLFLLPDNHKKCNGEI